MVMMIPGNFSIYNVTREEAFLPLENDGEGSLAINLTGEGDNISGGAVTGYNKPWPLLKQPTHMVVVLSLAYVIVLLLGVINNSLVVSVIYRNPQLRSVTNYFIANLAVADIFVCIVVLPITLLTNLLTGKYIGVCFIALIISHIARVMERVSTQ